MKETLPIIDVSPLWKNKPEEWKKVASEIDNACRSIGFFYIVGHPISQIRMNQMINTSKDFFKLPVDQKMEADMSKNEFHRGYAAKNLEQMDPSSPFDEKETLEMGVKLDPNNPLISSKHYGPNLFPSCVQSSTIELMEQHYTDLNEVLKMLLRAIAESLQLEREFFTQYYDYPMAIMRLMHYTSFDNSHPIGGGAHTDYGCLTILQQDDVGGLQVKNTSGEWMDVPPIPGSFVVNIGDMLQRWSNNVYRSTEHRVLKPPKGVERYSIPFFGEPRCDALVSCIPSCCTSESPAKFNPIKASDYFQSRLAYNFDYKNQSVA